MTCKINDMEFTPIKGVKYRYDYEAIAREIEKDPKQEIPILRAMIKDDLWSIVFFVMKNPLANHPYVVRMCAIVEEGVRNNTLDLWFRGGFKSTIITIAETVQDIVKNSEERICVLSYTRPAALSFVRQIKQVLEGSEFLIHLFGDVLHSKPSTEAFRWSEETGLFVKRQSLAKEATVEGWGLIDGMPTRQHYTKLVYDDIVTADMVNSPDMLEKAKERYDMSLALKSPGCRVRALGTTYHYNDVLSYLKSKKTPDGKPIYKVRTRPATEKGKPNGRSVFLPEAELNEYRANQRVFRSQYLLDPTPRDECKLDPDRLVMVDPKDVPSGVYKFMLVDPAGSEIGKDAWAMHVIGVDPFMDDVGNSDVYILDSLIEAMDLFQAMDAVVAMYCRHSRILKLGVEKVGAMTMEVHVANALRAKGRFVSIEAGTMEILRPAGRSKEMRIESLAWPLNNSKIKISRAVNAAYIERLKFEMRKFPYWHDDGLDALSYGYDLIKNYRFTKRPTKEQEDAWDKAFRQMAAGTEKDNWMVV